MVKQSLTLPTVDLEALRWLAVRQALQESNGNRTRAAEKLGIHLRTLQKLNRQLRPAGDIPFYVARSL